MTALPIYRVKKFIDHWLSAVDDHSVHSPYFFDLYKSVVKSKQTHPQYALIEDLRTKLLNNKTEIEVTDLGAASSYFSASKRRRAVADIARTSLSPLSFCQFYHRLASHIQAQAIMELGTSLGITSLYLSISDHVQLTTFEGSHVLAQIALTHFEGFERKNVNLIEGNIDTTLEAFLQKPVKIDLVLMDANHTFEATVRYFNLLTKRLRDRAIVIVDDIYHSADMERAWQHIKEHELVYGTVDFFRCGLAFFDPALNRQHYVWTLAGK